MTGVLHFQWLDLFYIKCVSATYIYKPLHKSGYMQMRQILIE